MSAAEDEIEFRCDGCVWQNTGEDWNDVELHFSTQRPSLGVEPPTLAFDYLKTRKKSTETVVAERDQEVDELAPDVTDAISPVTSKEIPGIDDGGEAFNLPGKATARVPSDGLPVRIEIFSFRAPASLERVLYAEVAPQVVLKTTQKNAAPTPILAGPVDLVYQGGLVGRSSVLYVAPGETFTLGWGPDPSLRAQRSYTKGAPEKDDMLGNWLKASHSVTVTLSNLGLDTREVTVTERVPLSEVKQVEVIYDAKAATDGALPDTKGFVSWKVSLGPRGRRNLKLAYAVRRGKGVVGLD